MGTMQATASLIVACALVSLGLGHLRNEVCGDIKPNTTLNLDEEFDFQPNFKVHVEAVLPDQQRITNCWVEFSTPRRMLKTTMKSDGLNFELYYDFQNHETLEYNLLSQGRGSCKVHADMSERQGFFLVPESPEKGKTPKVAEILRFSGNSGFANEKISAEKTYGERFRALMVTKYESCQKITTADNSVAIVKVTHILTAVNLARNEPGPVPLQVTFEGKFVSGPSNGKALKHIYNFFHYSTTVGDDDFQTPLGIVCKGRFSPNNFPKPPLHVQFGTEFHDSQTSQVFTLKTVYDKEFNFVAQEYFNPQPGKHSEYRFDDFESGLSYEIDRNINTCETHNITDVTDVGDYMKLKDGKIKMMTPEQFWDREGVQYHYNGLKHFRGLETEAWIGQDEKTGYMYEWYFTYGIRYGINDEAISEQTERHRVPYKTIVWPDNTPQFFSVYFFQVDLTTPPLLLDLSLCFPNHKKFVSLYVKELTLDRVEKGETLILRKAVKALSQDLGVPFTRISGPQIVFRGDKGYILFDLLDLSEKSSDLITQTDNQPNLAQALKLLKEKAAKGTLVFEVGDGETSLKSPVQYLELAMKQSKGGDSGYSPGALAGLCLTMIVVGLAAGGGGGYWFFIRH